MHIRTNDKNKHAARFLQLQRQVESQALTSKKTQEDLQKVIDKQATVIAEQVALIDLAKDTEQRFVLTVTRH